MIDVVLKMHQCIRKSKDKVVIVLLKVIGLSNAMQIDVEFHGEGIV